MDDTQSDPKLAPIQDRLRHVYWIGGGSGAGKSTVAGRITAKHGFRIYDTDKTMVDHGTWTSPEHGPLLRRCAQPDAATDTAISAAPGAVSR